MAVSDIVVPSLSKEFDRAMFPDVDLIVSCGDLPPEYLSSLTLAFDVPMCYVKGNHDFRYREKPPVCGIDLHANVFGFKGLRFFGLEGSRWYNGGPYQYTERRMKRLAGKMRPVLWWKGGVDVIVTHAPPRHIHDDEDPCHKGFGIFRTLIERYRPLYFLHGHVHGVFDDPEKRVTKTGRTKVVNCCGYIFLDIEEQKESNG